MTQPPQHIQRAKSEQTIQPSSPPPSNQRDNVIRTRRTPTRSGRSQEVGSVIVKIELMGKTEGHPVFQISMSSRKDNFESTTLLMKRFKHFRALHNKVTNKIK